MFANVGSAIFTTVEPVRTADTNLFCPHFTIKNVSTEKVPVQSVAL